VVAGPAIRIIYLDGSCLNCEFGAAANPAFEPSGTVISFIQNRHVALDGIDGIRERSPPPGVATDAVWSAGGLLAVVRNGAILAGRAGRLREIGIGSEPSWSPHGALIAAAQHGWIVIIGVRGGRVRRLVRGAAPAFSPDGRWIAYVAPNHRLMIVPAVGRHPAPRAVGNIRAVSVDWQPKPPGSRPGCSAPPGSAVLASSPAAVVTGDGVLHPRPLLRTSVAYMGCLRADGRVRLLERLSTAEGYSVSFVGSAVLAAPYAGLVLDDVDSHDDDQSSTVQVFDLRTGGLQTKLGGERASCPDDGPSCLGPVVLGSDGVSGAHARLSPVGYTLSAGVSCAPATTMCVAVDDLGHVISSTNPSGGPQAWKIATLAPDSAGLGPSGPTMIDCPSTSLCVGATDANTNIYTSTDPTAGASVWTATVLPRTPFQVSDDMSCPSVKLCIVLRTEGSVATSTNPTGGASAWSISNIESAPTAIFCSTQPECFVSDSAGPVFTSTDPTGGASAWTVSTSTPPFTSGTCPTTSLCVAVNGHEVQATTNPGAGSWTTQAVVEDLYRVACPSASLCVAIGDAGALDVSTNPALGPWTHTTIDDGQPLTSIACPSASLCVAADVTGHVVSSTDPTGGPSAWTPALINPCADTCGVEQIQTSDSTGLHTVDSSELPGSGPFLTGLTLTADVLSWSHDGTPRSLTLTP